MIRVSRHTVGSRGFTILALVGAVFVLMGASSAWAQRLAIVIGNQDYTHVESLRNPVNDADQVRARLESLEFDVLHLPNVRRDDLVPQLDAFLSAYADPDFVLFYFSGHGVEVEGVNYLLPVDADFSVGQTMADQAWALQPIMQRIEALGTDALFLIDACRNNPLPPRVRDQYAVGNGLARIESGASSKFVFATLWHSVAYEGLGDTSFFTQALLDHMGTPGQSLDDMIRRVRNQVRTETFERQIPFSGGNLSEAFYFAPAIAPVRDVTDADLENLLLNYAEAEREKVLVTLADTVGLDLNRLSERMLAMADETSVDAIIAGSQVVLDPASQTAPPDTVRADQTMELAQTDETPETRTGPPTLSPVSPTSFGRAMSAVTVDQAQAPRVLTPVAPVRVSLSSQELTASFNPESSRLPRDVLGANGAVVDALRPLEGRDLASAVQEQLARLGCYQARIDGLFGNLSRLALSRYYIAKGVVFDDLVPTDSVLRQLQLEPSVICTGRETRVARVLLSTQTIKVPSVVRPKPGVIAKDKVEDIETGRVPLGIRFR